MEEITKNYKIKVNPDESRKIQELVSSWGWEHYCGECGVIDIYCPYLLIHTEDKEIQTGHESAYDSWGGYHEITAKEFIRRFGPEEDNEEVKIGELVEWEGGFSDGTGYFMGKKENDNYLVEVIASKSETGTGWERDKEVPSTYENKATNRYYWVESINKIEEKKELKTKFKVGDKVRNKETGEEDTVLSVPGMEKYDSMGFGDAKEGMRLDNSSWERQKYWEKVETGEVQPTDDNKPIIFVDEVRGDVNLDTTDDFEDLSAPDLFEKSLEEFKKIVEIEEENRRQGVTTPHKGWYMSCGTS